jgi:hypothetical protein
MILNKNQSEGAAPESSLEDDDTRNPHYFTDIETALDAARKQFPTTFIVAIGGDMKTQSSYAYDSATVRTIAGLRHFGEHEGDTLVIWLRGKPHAAPQAA